MRTVSHSGTNFYAATFGTEFVGKSERLRSSQNEGFSSAVRYISSIGSAKLGNVSASCIYTGSLG
jgi:hypothetical protein